VHAIVLLSRSRTLDGWGEGSYRVNSEEASFWPEKTRIDPSLPPRQVSTGPDAVKINRRVNDRGGWW
jgi:hypothetical protein